MSRFAFLSEDEQQILSNINSDSSQFFSADRHYSRKSRDEVLDDNNGHHGGMIGVAGGASFDRLDRIQDRIQHELLFKDKDSDPLAQGGFYHHCDF